jgi:hypothetical protein
MARSIVESTLCHMARSIVESTLCHMARSIVESTLCHMARSTSYLMPLCLLLFQENAYPFSY